MITIKLNTFSDKEKSVLYDLVNEMQVMFIECYCPKFRSVAPICETCEHRHVCYDVEKIYSFMRDQINEITQKNSQSIK